jgi:hypothetical protein
VVQRQDEGFPLDQNRVAYLRYLRTLAARCGAPCGLAPAGCPSLLGLWVSRKQPASRNGMALRLRMPRLEHSMDDREQELQDVPHRPTDKSTWPKGVQSISYNGVDALGTDAKGELYWHGKPVEIRRPLDLTRIQNTVAIIVAFATVAALGAVAQGFAAYNEWACKVGWTSAACPPATQAAPPPPS